MTRTRIDRASASAACLVIVSIAAVACSRIGGSGKIITKAIPVSSFSKLQVGSSFEVNVSFGDQEALTLHIDDRVDTGADSLLFTAARGGPLRYSNFKNYYWKARPRRDV